MTDQDTAILQQAMLLSESERAELAEQLYASLSSTPIADAEIRAAWLVEVERRAAELVSGSPGIPLEEAWPRIAGKYAQAVATFAAGGIGSH